MLESERLGGIAVVSVPTARKETAIRRLKGVLSDDERDCPECVYTGAEARWGLKTVSITDPDRVAIVLCCPACEAKVDLDPELVGEL